MFELQPQIIRQMREMADRNVSPSEMLRAALEQMGPQEPVMLVQYLMQAFCLELHEVTIVFGWRPDATGEIPDRRLDGVLSQRIRARANEWNVASPPFQSTESLGPTGAPGNK